MGKIVYLSFFLISFLFVFSSEILGVSSSPSLSPLPSLSPSPTASSTSIPSPSVTPSPLTATYKINNAKNDQGTILNSVKIYVDNNYIHHYPQETLTFCNSCQCYSGVNCGFGNHTIRLEKTSYEDWQETRTLNPGDYIEVNPIMDLIEQEDLPSPSPPPNPSPSTSISPSPSSSLIASNKPSPSPSNEEKINEASMSGEILGEESSQSAQPAQNSQTTNNKKFLLPLIISFIGIILLAISGYSLIKSKRIKIKS